MGILNRKNGGITNVIRCDEPSYLIWKWHPAGAQPGESKRENSIRFGSSLRVKDGEVAVFVYKQRNGIVQDYIEGPFDQTLNTKNLPVLSGIIGLAYGGDTPFQAEVYFINLAKIIQVRFAVPFFDVFDPRFQDFGVPVAVRGTISLSITDYKDFIKLHRLTSFSLEDFQKQIRDAVSRYVKSTVANAPAENNIPVIQLENRIAQINDVVEYDISERFKETFGVTVTNVDISSIEIDKTSYGYSQLMQITQRVTQATVQAQTAADIKNIHDMQKINAENYAETMRIQREEAQYAQHKETQSANISAFQVEKQAEVGIAGANALGQMGANGAGSINFGSEGGGAGFNPAAMMTGMAMGGVVGQNLAGMMNNAMSGMNQTNAGVAVPPPVPTSTYHIVINNQSAGPFDIQTLTHMSIDGRFTRKTLVWKSGMSDWAEAGTIQELSSIFASVLPPIPPIP